MEALDYSRQQAGLYELVEEWNNRLPEGLHGSGGIERLAAIIQLQGSVQSGLQPVHQRLSSAIATS